MQRFRRCWDQGARQSLGALFVMLLLVANRVTPLAAQAEPKAADELGRALQRRAPDREAHVLAVGAADASGVQTVLELPPVADSYVASNRPNQSFGADSLYLGYNQVGDAFGVQRIFMRFDIAGNLPANATIQSARLRLRLSFSSPVSDTVMTTVLRPLTGVWNESNLTWSNQPALGAERPGIGVGSALDWYEWDVTELVREWTMGATVNNGVALIGDETVQQRERAFYARETTTDFFPRLVVDYTTPVDIEAPIVTVDPLPALVSRNFTVVWRGNDRGGSGIDYYDVQYRVDGGDWVNWQSHVTFTSAEFTEGLNGHHYEFRARGVDTVGNAEAFGNPEASTTVDTQPPTSQIQALPVITRTNPISVSWAGDDGGGSGIQYYDVQYRLNDGPWTLWQQQTVVTTAPFVAPEDGIYEFEVRAVDNRGQVEEFTNRREAIVIIDAVAPFVEPVAWFPLVEVAAAVQ